jgi:TIR domain
VTQVFISYSRKDLAFAQRIARDLTVRMPQATVFYDMLILPGASWADTLATQIEQSDCILALLSPDYLESPWAQQEIKIAIARKLNNQARLIPLVVRSCSPTGLLATLTWVDFTNDYDSALTLLIWGITGERPPAAKGVQPGALSTPLDTESVESIRREVHASVTQFKSHPAAETPDDAPRAPDSAGKKQCFVVMPFGNPDLQVVYEDFVKPTIVERCGLLCERGDDVFGSNGIMDDILKSIDAAHVVLADLTGKNANVFYEVGICHALGKPVLLLAQSMEDVPFDLRHRRVLLYEYSPRGCKRLEQVLPDNMQALMTDHK